MMMSSNRNVFRVTSPLCSPVTDEFPSQRPVTRSFDVFFDLRPNKRLSKQSGGWRIETPSRSLWRTCNCDVLVKYVYTQSILYFVIWCCRVIAITDSNMQYGISMHKVGYKVRDYDLIFSWLSFIFNIIVDITIAYKTIRVAHQVSYLFVLPCIWSVTFYGLSYVIHLWVGKYLLPFP